MARIAMEGRSSRGTGRVLGSHGDAAQGGAAPGPVEHRRLTEEEKEKYGLTKERADAIAPHTPAAEMAPRGDEVAPAAESKTCSACGLEKPEGQFTKGRNQCKACMAAYAKEQYRKKRLGKAAVIGPGAITGGTDAKTKQEAGEPVSFAEIAAAVRGRAISEAFIVDGDLFLVGVAERPKGFLLRISKGSKVGLFKPTDEGGAYGQSNT